MAGEREHEPRLERHRVQVIGKLTVEDKDGGTSACLCNTLDMSLSGALVETGAALTEGSVLTYTFSLPGVRNLVDITGEVTRTEARRGARPGPGPAGARENPGRSEETSCYGIRFLEMKGSTLEALRAFLAPE